MRCLVTGGAGFIGSHLTKHLLDNGHTVVVVDNLSNGCLENIDPRAQFEQVNILNQDQISPAMKNVDVVYHLAAHAGSYWSVYTPINSSRINYLGSITIVTEAINHNVERFVFVSSMARYGVQSRLPYTEDMIPNPATPYAVAKYAVELAMKSLCQVHEMDYTVVIPQNVYGPQQNLTDPYRSVIALFMNRLLSNESPIIYGDGTQKQIFTYVGDLVPALARAGYETEVSKEVVNVCSGHAPVSIGELAKILIEMSGLRLKPIFMPARRNEGTDSQGANDKARKKLGYKDTVTLQEGLNLTWNWARKAGIRRWEYNEVPEIPSDDMPEPWKHNWDSKKQQM
jgi:UDP-glucose 4-epimerase